MLGQLACAREREVLETVASGQQHPDVQAHLATCARCREAVAVSKWMHQLSDTTGETHALPDPGLLWWRAQLVRRWQAEREASAPVEAMQRVELGVGLVSLVALLVWLGPTLWRWIVGTPMTVDPLTLTGWVAVLDSGLMLAILPVAAALLGIATLVTVTRMMLTE